MEHVAMIIKGIPSDLRDQFKAWCAMNGTTMTAELIRLMESRIKEGKS